MSLDVAAYLHRIDHPVPSEPSAASLATLHRAHLLAVPFENLDIHRKVPLRLDEASLFDKIVRRRRGGFCFELNGLFASLLRALGYEVQLLSARVHGEGDYSPEFDHLALLVRLDTPWLADVGFGDFFLAPLRFDSRDEQRDGDRHYRLEREGDRVIVHEKRRGDDFKPGYSLSTIPRTLEDFSQRCVFHQTSAESHFMKHRICSVATLDGRVTLRDGGLVVTRHGEKTESPILDEARALERYFGIVEAQAIP